MFKVVKNLIIYFFYGKKINILKYFKLMEIILGLKVEDEFEFEFYRFLVICVLLDRLFNYLWNEVSMI